MVIKVQIDDVEESRLFRKGEERATSIFESDTRLTDEAFLLQAIKDYVSGRLKEAAVIEVSDIIAPQKQALDNTAKQSVDATLDQLPISVTP